MTDQEQFDPGAHTVEEVAAYLEQADDTETARVLDAEAAGKDRAGIAKLTPTEDIELGDAPPTTTPADAPTKAPPSGRPVRAYDDRGNVRPADSRYLGKGMDPADAEDDRADQVPAGPDSAATIRPPAPEDAER